MATATTFFPATMALHAQSFIIGKPRTVVEFVLETKSLH